MFLVGISFVSAENIDEIGTLSSSDIADDAISLDDNVDGTIDDVESDVSTNSADDEVISDGEPTRSTYTWGDFKSEVENTSINTVELNRGNIAPSTSSSDQVRINHDITIVGGYGYYIGSASWSSAPKYNYIPIVTSGNNLNVKFENVTFQYLSNNIFIKLMGNGNYTFKNCIFDHINATGSHQSVIWLNYGQALIENCTFTNCTCSFGAVTNYYSSTASTANYARMTVKDSTFKDNYATTEPGAINNCGYLEVYDSVFENNEAFWWAGAIHTHMYANTTIVRSNFRNNLAGWNGGALYTYSYLRVVNSTFTGNNATTNTGGGAIGASNYGSNPTVIIENSKFENNTALTGAGGTIVISSGTLTVSDSEFINNAAPKINGGAISSTSGTATITNSVFKYNSAVLGKGGAIYGGGNGRLTVDRCEFVNNTAKDDNSGHALAYSYTGSSNTAAYLNYTNNIFYGPNNGAGSIYAANSYLNVYQYNNTISDYSNYTEPEEENDTNGSSGDIIDIPEDTHIGHINWTVNLGDALSGTPVVEGDYILIPAGHTLYCYTLNGTYVWNVTNQWAYFHEVLVNDTIVYAPCSGDKLYILDLSTGNSLTNNNIYQGSSMYAPIIYDGMIYICSEYGYGSSGNSWITIVEPYDDEYYYYDSIIDLWGVEYGTQAFVSNPIGYGDNLFVNTIFGLILYNIPNQVIDLFQNTIGSPVADAYGNIYINFIDYDDTRYILKFDNTNYIIYHVEIEANCELLVGNNASKVYTVDEDGVIYCVDFNDESVICYGEWDEFNINHVSSAMTFDDNNLYIGDDAGILWVIDTTGSPDDMEEYLYWAFNANSSIVGGIAVEDDVVYMGTEDGTFYAITY